MKTVILEDEKAAVRNLTVLLSEVAPEVEVLQILDSVSDGIDWFENNPVPELVFMDIHLADGSSFEIFDHVELNCPIIFTTAYDEYALKAFKVNSIDYLLKPIGRQDIQKALLKLHQLHAKHEQHDLSQFINSFKNKESYKSHFLIPVKGDKLLPVSVDMIAYFYIAEGVVRTKLYNGKEYVMSQTLDELTDHLNPRLFFRANRQYLIGREAIEDIDLWFNNRLSVNLKLPVSEKILISKMKVGEFKDWFSNGV